MFASDLCRDAVPQVRGETTAAACAEAMVRQRATCAVVVDQSRPLGLVRLGDALSATADEEARRFLASPRFAVATMPLDELARAAAQAAPDPVLVTSDDGRYVGVVTAGDVLRALEESAAPPGPPPGWPSRLLDQVPLILWSTDRELGFTASAGRGLRELGLEPGDRLGRTLSEELQTADPDFPPNAAHAAALRGESASYEQTWAGRVYRCWVEPLRTSRGEVAGTVGVALDVTDLRHAERALRESEARFRRLFDSEMMGVLFWRADGAITDANDAFLRMIGATRAELAAGEIRWSDLTPSDHLPRDEAALREIAERGYCVPFQKQYIRPDGQRIDVLVGGASLDNDPRSGVCFVLDVTARMGAERRLADSEERYRRLVELCPEGIITHRDGKFLYLNPAALRILGAERADQLVGRPVLSVVHPDFQEIARDRIRGIVDAGATAALLEEKLVRLDGRVIVAEVIGAPVVLDGLPAVLTVFRDVTARKQAEESARLAYEELETRVQQRTAELAAANAALRTSQARLQKLVEQSPISTQVVSPDGRLLVVNRAFERLWGVTLADLADYNLLHDPQLQANGLLRHVRRALQGENVSLEEVEYVPDRGSFQGVGRWTNVRIYPVTDEAGSVCEIVILHEDVTERHTAKDEVRHLSRRLEQASRLSVMGEMAAGIAHELHQPLQVIANYANGCVRRLAAGEQTGDAFLEPLREIAHEAVHAGNVVRRIKSLIQQREPTRGRVDLNEVARDVARLARLTLADNEVSIRLTVSEEPAVVFADGAAVAQAILNLVLNASDAMRGARRRELSLTVLCGPLDECGVEVADTGSGIPAEVQDRIFEQFFTTKAEGLGLGLPISRSIAEAHGGRLTLVETGPHGTTFRLMLPKAEE